ncbi:hypothetical protein ACU686_08920 [Yinghuangia aomiensis]
MVRTVVGMSRMTGMALELVRRPDLHRRPGRHRRSGATVRAGRRGRRRVPSPLVGETADMAGVRGRTPRSSTSKAGA